MMIITIDGPAGAGKSSAARGLARRLGYRFLDTGSLYRAVTLAGLRQQVDWNDAEALARITKQLKLELSDDRVLVDGEDVTQEIRSFKITTLTRHAADNPEVRRQLIDLQRELVDGADVVTEGRDQATVAFPEAECKIFLTAGEEVRARRRHADLCARGEQMTLAEVLQKQRLRDQRDQSREFGGLTKTDASIEVLTDDLTPEQVVDRLEQIVRSCQR